LGVHPPGRRQRRLPRASDEGGQILVLTGVALVLMLCCVGLVVDVGHAMLVQRQLQAGVDAAALAGVQHLPDATAAETVAQQYSATPGSKNAVNTVDNATTVAQASCLAGVPGCNRRDGGVNGLTVTSRSTVPTWFGRIIGIDQMKVSAKATACSPCQVKPLDIMIVLDRTGSMCQFAPGVPDSNCTDLNNARDGIETFASMLDPSLDKLGLALTPPVVIPSMISNCGNPTGSGYRPWSGTPNPNVPSGHPSRNVDGRYYGYDSWWPDVNGLGGALPGWSSAGRVWTVDPRGQTPSRYLVASLNGADGLTADDYLVFNPASGDWELNYAQSPFLQRLNCTSGAGSTSYALPIEEAQHELERNGRGTVQDVIIFLSDGAANTAPRNIPSTHWMYPDTWRVRPCGAGVESAAWAKSKGTVIYTIGYDLDAGGSAPERCLSAASSNGHQGSNPEPVQAWGSTAYDAIRAMATSPQHFYNKPNPGQLNDIFRAIAIDLSGSKARLIDNTAPNLIG
jgi:hypothetical protein